MQTLPIQPYLETLAEEFQESVARSLDRTGAGYNKDLTTPLVPDKDNPTQGRQMRIDEFNSFVFDGLPDWLEEDEVTQREKIGPFSIMLPFELRKESVLKYYSPRETNINGDAAEYASSMLSGLVKSRLHHTSLDTAYEVMPRGTNLGLPYPTADQEWRRPTLELAREVGRQGFHWDLHPAMLFWRGQPRGLEETPKQRNVWGVPHVIILWELTIQRAFLHYVRNDLTFAAWVGTRRVNEGVTTAFRLADHGILSVDFSGFDVSVPGSILHEVFNIMRSWFTSASGQIIDFMERSFLTIPLLAPDGIYIGRDGGVPSGQGGTNMIDTLVQIWANFYAAFRMRNEIEFQMAQGDDGVIVFKKPWRVDDYIDAMSELNLDVSDSKGGVSDTVVHYLQNVHYIGYQPDGTCAGVRPAFRVLNGMLSYERFRKAWSGYFDSFRWMQQVNNAQFHPKFEQIVDFEWENDKYVREYTYAELLKEANGLSAVESALGQDSFPPRPARSDRFGECQAGGDLGADRARIDTMTIA
jgi:hypothetical protein